MLLGFCTCILTAHRLHVVWLYGIFTAQRDCTLVSPGGGVAGVLSGGKVHCSIDGLVSSLANLSHVVRVRDHSNLNQSSTEGYHSNSLDASLTQLSTLTWVRVGNERCTKAYVRTVSTREYNRFIPISSSHFPSSLSVPRHFPLTRPNIPLGDDPEARCTTSSETGVPLTGF